MSFIDKITWENPHPEIWRDKENLIVRGKIAFLGRNQTWLPSDYKPSDTTQLIPQKPKVD